jgi:glucose/mannose-6-phosphate isomerase
MSVLDSPSLYTQLDPSGMLQHLHRFPEQCRRAWDSSARLHLPPEYASVNRVVISGMGGSAIGGEFIRRLAAVDNSVPVAVHRDYGLPPFVDRNTLLIFSSYSGNTEETISCFAESLSTAARKLAITTGGKLRELAQQEGFPVLTIDYASPPRAAFPHSFVSLLGVFNALGLIRDKTADFQEALQVLGSIAGEAGEGVPLASNPAKQLAAELHGRLSVVYGAGLLTEVAQRWKTQINENSKAWAFYETLPELNHNAVVGYQFPPEVGARAMVVLLHSPLLHQRVSVRYRLTQEILAQQAVKHRTVEATGRGALAQMLGMVLLGDYVSLYLAMLNRVDPSGVPQIDYLKSRLSQS